MQIYTSFSDRLKAGIFIVVISMLLLLGVLTLIGVDFTSRSNIFILIPFVVFGLWVVFAGVFILLRPDFRKRGIEINNASRYYEPIVNDQDLQKLNYDRSEIQSPYSRFDKILIQKTVGYLDSSKFHYRVAISREKEDDFSLFSYLGKQEALYLGKEMATFMGLELVSEES
ncbi:MAG: hypothetical protein KDE33_27095 [Bacteroidetes bacterium]|nr:hypothetical protein [Bacteroidota bacterium]